MLGRKVCISRFTDCLLKQHASSSVKAEKNKEMSLSGLRLSVGDERGPILHQPGALDQIVRALLGQFHSVADFMRKAGLDDLAGMVGLLGRPCREAGAEAMHRLALTTLQAPKALQHRHVG